MSLQGQAEECSNSYAFHVVGGVREDPIFLFCHMSVEGDSSCSSINKVQIADGMQRPPI